MPCPDCCPTSPLEIASQLATAAGALGLLLALYSWRQSRAAFYQAVLVSCATRFQKLGPKLGVPVPTEKIMRQYLELCNEELFYFEQRYLPQGIIDEWVEGMVELIGCWHQPTAATPPELLYPPRPTSADQRRASLLYERTHSYPRLRHALTITDARQARRVRPAGLPTASQGNEADYLAGQRASAVLAVLANLRCYQQQPFYATLRRRRAEQWGVDAEGRE